MKFSHYLRVGAICTIEELKGFDVIDTPGMNDPVLSRTQKTKEEMARCDVVFFLSRSGQFLDQSDIHLLANRYPKVV